jgi:hypothetical protein
MGVPVGEESSNLRGRGAKRDCVPVPVLCKPSVYGRDTLRSTVPVWSMFSRLQYLADQVKVLVFFMLVNDRLRLDIFNLLWHWDLSYGLCFRNRGCHGCDVVCSGERQEGRETRETRSHFR